MAPDPLHAQNQDAMRHTPSTISYALMSAKFMLLLARNPIAATTRTVINPSIRISTSNPIRKLTMRNGTHVFRDLVSLKPQQNRLISRHGLRYNTIYGQSIHRHAIIQTATAEYSHLRKAYGLIKSYMTNKTPNMSCVRLRMWMKRTSTTGRRRELGAGANLDGTGNVISRIATRTSNRKKR